MEAVSVQDMEKYKAVVTESARMSEIIHKNFTAVTANDGKSKFITANQFR